MKSLKTTVQKCARCGQDHENITFTEFSLEPVVDSDGTIWNYWTPCPTNGEPILLKVIQIDD